MHAGLTRTLHRPIAVALAVSVLISGVLFGRQAATAHADEAAQQALSPAITAYLRDQGSPLANQVTVQITDQAGAFVRASVVPADQAMYDSATAFAKYEHGTWTILSIGTAFLPEDCTAFAIPATLPCQ